MRHKVLAVISCSLLFSALSMLTPPPAVAYTCQIYDAVEAYDTGSSPNAYGTSNVIQVRSHNLSGCSDTFVETEALMYPSGSILTYDEVYYEYGQNGFNGIWTFGVIDNVIQCDANRWTSIPLDIGGKETFRVENVTIGGDSGYWHFEVVDNGTTYGASHCYAGMDVDHGFAGGGAYRYDHGADGSGLLTTEQPVKYQTSQGSGFTAWVNPHCLVIDPATWYYHDLSNPKGFEFNENSSGGSSC